MSLWWQASLEWGWLPVVTKLFGNEPLRPLTAQLVCLGIQIHPPILGGFCFEPHMVGSLSEVYSYWKWPIYSWFSHQKLWFSIVMLVYQRCIYIYIHIYRLVLVSFYESFVKKRQCVFTNCTAPEIWPSSSHIQPKLLIASTSTRRSSWSSSLVACTRSQGK